ncbi:acyltransferase family protein [Tropicimonas sp. IMCC34011]|uniref:acyltransferase family protein n=1 Tax=Tropicimonas sp. IMCC34011 TaxID=2248759 RepID=UPI000E27A832|nr:acyltransferase family protein [Tropicimonas sp. IMCC34011]
MKYRSEIDGLRAIAVVPVILFHAGYEVFSGGFVGVDVFFVISGYLITTIIINEMDEGKFSLLSFYERRARRILPALFFVVLCCIPAACLLLLPSDMEDFAQSLVAVATFSSNILFWRESGYFATAAELKPLLHTWSLAVEEQFYILFPLFLMTAWRYGNRAIVWALIFIFFVSLMTAHWGAYNEPSATFYLLPTRAWELLIGSLAAFYLQKRSGGTPHRLNSTLSAIGLTAICYSIFAFDEATPFPSLYALVPSVGTGLVILFTTKGTLTHTLLSLRVFVGVGTISYSLYLWHQPLFAFWRQYNVFEPTHEQMLLLSLLCLPLAYFTYRFVESPFRGRTGCLSRKGVFGTSSISILTLILAGFAGHFSAGFPSRLSVDDRALMNLAAPSPLRDDCHFGSKDYFSASESCRYFENPGASWAVYGNSHGVELAYGIAQLLENRGEGVWHFTISGCSASFDSSDVSYCDDFFRSRLEYITQTEDIENIILAFRSETSGLDAAESMIQLANHLHRLDKNVYLILQAPTLPNDINAFIRRAIVSGNTLGSIASKSRDVWKAEYGDVLSSLSLLEEGITIVDLADVFCDHELCYAIRNGIPLYFDDDHMSVAAAQLAAVHIFKQIE